jgi:hypothetical protein
MLLSPLPWSGDHLLLRDIGISSCIRCSPVMDLDRPFIIYYPPPPPSLFPRSVFRHTVGLCGPWSAPRKTSTCIGQHSVEELRRNIHALSMDVCPWFEPGSYTESNQLFGVRAIEVRALVHSAAGSAHWGLWVTVITLVMVMLLREAYYVDLL